MKFLDLVQVHIRSGKGGVGSASFRHERNLEYGGPDGGDGGRGGDVRAEAVAGPGTLVDFRYRPHIFADNGRHGAGKGRTGRAGAAAVLEVPAGTEILEADGETVIADLSAVGDGVLLVPGGAGGRGNLHFKSATNRAPRRADRGGTGTERTLWLRLKLIADAGLVGLPNAGKSTFLKAVSNARPEVADYPFTTLVPHLGVARTGGGEVVLADIPGLIAGAHAGRGLGDRFLGHVERCAVLLHLVDATSGTVGADYATTRAELARYGHGLAGKPVVTALSKIDALDAAALEARRAELVKAAGAPVHAVSGASGAGGVAATLDALAAELAARHAPRAEPEGAEPWHP